MAAESPSWGQSRERPLRVWLRWDHVDREEDDPGERLGPTAGGGGMSEAAGMLREFHDTFGGPGAKTDDLWLRGTLHREEADELVEALQEWVGALGVKRISRGDTFPPTQDGIRKAVARELADVVYVAYGTALIAGIELDVALAEIHRSNMSKLGEDGKPVLREDGKVLKGPHFREPDLTEAIRPGRRVYGEVAPA